MTETHVCCYYYDEQHNRCKCYVNENLDALLVENAKLRGLCSELLRMAESHDPEWLHWPEMHEELRKLGVEVEP